MDRERDREKGDEERESRLRAELKVAQETVNEIRKQLGEPNINFIPFPQNDLERKVFAKVYACPFCDDVDVKIVNLHDGDLDEETYQHTCDCGRVWIVSYRLHNVYSEDGGALRYEEEGARHGSRPEEG